jgi:CRISPR/Cas system CMR-associated protein Cmr3 (group 5 of RAMP superfamily)
VYNGATGFATNKFSVGKHTVKIMPISLKYKGSVTTSIIIKKSAKKYSNFLITV